VHLLNAKSNVM